MSGAPRLSRVKVHKEGGGGNTGTAPCEKEKPSYDGSEVAVLLRGSLVEDFDLLDAELVAGEEIRLAAAAIGAGLAVLHGGIILQAVFAMGDGQRSRHHI